MNIVICAIAKLENNYIYDWAKYHLDIGVNHIFIYDNNEIDGERIEDVFRDTALENRVTVLNARGQKKAQLKVYNAFYHTFDFDWCAFIDIDEFITFNPSANIQSINDFLSNLHNCDAVALNWLCYGDNGLVHFENESVPKRFLKPIKPLDFVASQVNGTPENYHIKSIIKKGLDIDWDEDHSPFKNPHVPSRITRIVNAKGESLSELPWQVSDYSVAFIRHYITMSIEEYLRKVQRGAADSNSAGRYNVSRFFRYNRITLKKLLVIKKSMGTVALYNIVVERFKWLSISNNWPSAFLFKSHHRSLNKRK